MEANLEEPRYGYQHFYKRDSVTYVKEEWTTLLLLVQKFFTCEGRFGVLYVYHAKVMMHFLGDDINLPYFLLSSLRKMCSIAQRSPTNVEPHLYHHGLVNMLVEEQLKAKRDTWEKFLVRNHFEEAGETSVPRKSRRKRKEATPETVVQEETVQEQIEEETDVHHSEHEIDPEPAVDTDQTAQGIITETLSELAQEVAQKRKESRMKQKKDKGKAVAQETYATPENSSEEDT